MFTALLLRSFFTTTTGQIGLGPRISQPGDLVVVLRDWNMPVILRKRPNGPNYQMTGLAYVHGIMDGEIMEAVERGEHQLQEIRID
ncbi:hypothetical protein LTR62_008585 [Meristemomyces frigidus]|uniref:Uncharacterized protein n=1 Tax=Meristemomyces frigidus TaxID=1508187 RepID=A0AAN7TMT6_9PEZI|nr:hypothetical protein LTR62_008585 [Meristemomyces frigidus]